MGDEFGLELLAAARQMKRFQGVDVMHQFGDAAAIIDLDAKLVARLQVAQVAFVVADLGDGAQVFAGQLEALEDARQ